MQKKLPKKQKLYVCTICGKQKKTAGKNKCCGKNMLTKDKALWTD